MMKCCDKELKTNFCPDCGKSLKSLIDSFRQNICKALLQNNEYINKLVKQLDVDLINNDGNAAYTIINDIQKYSRENIVALETLRGIIRD